LLGVLLLFTWYIDSLTSRPGNLIVESNWFRLITNEGDCELRQLDSQYLVNIHTVRIKLSRVVVFVVPLWTLHCLSPGTFAPLFPAGAAMHPHLATHLHPSVRFYCLPTYPVVFRAAFDVSGSRHQRLRMPRLPTSTPLVHTLQFVLTLGLTRLLRVFFLLVVACERFVWCACSFFDYVSLPCPPSPHPLPSHRLPTDWVGRRSAKMPSWLSPRAMKATP